MTSDVVKAKVSLRGKKGKNVHLFTDVSTLHDGLDFFGVRCFEIDILFANNKAHINCQVVLDLSDVIAWRPTVRLVMNTTHDPSYDTYCNAPPQASRANAVMVFER